MPTLRLRLLALALVPRLLEAQGGTKEIWPEIDVFWRPAEHQRSFLELSSSTEREANKKEGSVGLYQDYLFLPRGYLRAGYRFTFSIRDASYRESRLVTEATLGRDTPMRTRLVNRTRAEFRWINGEYSYRLRDRLHWQRLLKAARRWSPAPYVTFEAYYDSRYNTMSRLGGRVGVEAWIGGPTSIDLYIARQNNLRGEPPHVTALGLTAMLRY